MVLTNLQRTVRGLAVDASCPRSDSLGPSNIPNYLLFACVIWFLWKWRCKRVFEHDFSISISPNLIVTSFCKDWLNANVCPTRNVLSILVAWVPPSEGWVKLNVDGSCDGESGIITAGGVLRNHKKEWINGFAMNIGVGNVLDAEFWGLFEGFSMAWKLGFRRVFVESDSISVVQLIAKNSNINHPLFSLIQSCKMLIVGSWDCTVNHVFREGNCVADGLARLGYGKEIAITTVDWHPTLPVFLIGSADNSVRMTSKL
ncbi:hypothetical protein Dsin_013047 [Dipteronia sinensis]|uniref:RNase H type-1 domain-containing protein n=1 Tax=Dipteronia sinensis TaxID=43782 RepID=A0AAE0AJA7_9ROSI|nr:hypothetical protein Dsin_013047 [Dipteronia sinensis]